MCASRIAMPIDHIPSRLTRPLAPLLVALCAASAYSTFPHWLGYFNELAGGVRAGWWHLEDSNVDWGQDLMFLNEWIDTHPSVRPIHVMSHHWIDTTIYVADRPGGNGGMSYLAVDAYTLVHRERSLWKTELIDRVGSSFFIFRVEKR
jgi:hypothetical protein